MASAPTDEPSVGDDTSTLTPASSEQPDTAPIEPRSSDSEIDRSGARPQLYLWALVAIAPWSWFVIRDASGWADAIAIVLPLLIGIAFVLGAWWGVRRRTPLVLPTVVSLLFFGYASVIAPIMPDPTGAPRNGVRMMNANLESYWFSDNDFDWYLETHGTSLLVVSELQLSHRDDLRARFAHHVDDVIAEEQFRPEPDPDDTSYKRHGFPSIGVYSEFPLTLLEDTSMIEDGLPGLRVQVDLPTGPVVLYALHVPKPALGDGQYQVSLSRHRAMADAIADSVRTESLPVIVLGDLNMTDRGGSYRSLLSAGLTDGMLAERARPTSNKGSWLDLLRLRIDHLLVSEGLCTEAPRYDPIAFTDHLVMSAVVGTCYDG